MMKIPANIRNFSKRPKVFVVNAREDRVIWLVVERKVPIDTTKSEDKPVLALNFLLLAPCSLLLTPQLLTPPPWLANRAN